MTRQWRSLEEAAGDPAFLDRARREFPGLAEALARPASRRRVLQLMAASMALGGLSACTAPGDPYDQMVVSPVAPPNIVPALPNHYASANLQGGYATGIVVRHVMGRPVKVEGNPGHPASLGATDIHAQAMLLDFYDPDRAAGMTRGGLPATRQGLLAALTAERARLAESKGAGFRILTESTTSPALARQIGALLAQYPGARWHRWDAISRDAVRAGARLAYGAAVEIIPRPAQADVLLGIDSDMLSSAPGHVRLARDFASRRNPTRTDRMSRVFAVEPSPGLMGTAADHRFVAGPRELHAVALGLAAGILQDAAPAAGPDWLGGVIQELKAARGRALVHVGPDQPPETHALMHAVNEALSGRGQTFDVIDAVEESPVDQADSLRSLVDDMHAGRVETLVILGGNPVFAAPATLGFAEALKRVRFSLSMAPAPDETGAAALWFVPETHGFETWGDARAYDGTASILQPQALPLFGATSPHEILSLFASPFPRSALELVQETWKDRLGGDFDQGWHDALANGVIPDTASPAAAAKLRPEAAGLRPPAPPDRPLHVLFRPDPNLWDGRYANNPWLQELPRPLTKLVWDNPILIPAQVANRYGLENGRVVELSMGGARVKAPVWITPGQAGDCVTLLLGYGRTVVGDVGSGTGFDFFPLRGRDGAPDLRRTEERHDLASTDHHDVMDASPEDIVRHGTLDEFRKDPTFLNRESGKTTLYERPKLSDQAWGMSVDLNACIGCNACVLACQAENNIPVVGKEQVLVEREMHWLRIDRYYDGPVEKPDSYFQPILCMHCEEAPCEVVCPVEATLHDHEGINAMVYNRCIGTRFCSNNCPYKVRRFNFLAYARHEHRPTISRNPDVTARARGVMEKCTFCIQRIAEARIAADEENRPIRDGEVVTACQAACPTQVFAFGNINDPGSEVAKRKRSPLDYVLLPEESTHPRLTFEARIRNPSAKIPEGAA
jgi:MoCo/4Fe-4S cofactor protein with predicted Tat translocation signal